MFRRLHLISAVLYTFIYLYIYIYIYIIYYINYNSKFLHGYCKGCPIIVSWPILLDLSRYFKPNFDIFVNEKLFYFFPCGAYDLVLVYGCINSKQLKLQFRELWIFHTPCTWCPPQTPRLLKSAIVEV